MPFHRQETVILPHRLPHQLQRQRQNLQRNRKKDTSVSYKDGVYEGQAEGFDGIVTVKVTIKNGKIKKISNTNTDTPEFFNKAWKTIKSNVISRQSTSEIDTVSGATFSSNGILGALSQALSKADRFRNYRLKGRRYNSNPDYCT